MEQNQSPLVSIIIPVWNPGPGISRCIESLQNQTLEDIEMIFVDDCGTDDSMDKVKAASAEDSRIRILENEENIGSGPSRNKGIEAARGEYLSFVDPDDYVALDFYELLYAGAVRESFDIVKGNNLYIKEDGSSFVRDRELNAHIRKGLSTNRSLYTLFSYEHHSAIYRKELVISQNIRYGTSAREQDTTFLLKACSKAKSFSLVDCAYYYFCARSNSAMHTLNTTQLQGCLQARNEQLDYVLHNIPLNKETISYLQGLVLGGLREYLRYDYFLEKKALAQNYLLGLREIMERADLPTNLPFPLRILRDYTVALPTKPYYSPWEGMNPPVRYASLVERWADFYLNTPEERAFCWKEMRRLIITANSAVNGRPHSTYSKEEQKEGKKHLSHQIKRLPIDLQFQVALLKCKDKLYFFIHSRKRM